MAWARRRGSGFGALLVAASFGWFLLEWNNPGIGSALGFALGLTLYAVASPLVAHAALVYPGRRLSSRLDRLVLAAAYAGAIGVLGLAPALVFDPAAAVCTQCPSNLLLVENSPRLYDALNRIGVYAGLAWSLALVALLVLRLVRSSPALRRLLWPVLVPAASYLGLVAWAFAYSLDRGTLRTTSPVVRDLWLGQAGALIALAAGVVWGWLRARHTRAAVARLVVEAAASPAPGGLRDKLARMLRDPSVKVAYPPGRRQAGRRARPPLVLDGEVTPLVRGGENVALLSHRPGLLDDPDLADEVRQQPAWRSRTSGCRPRCVPSSSTAHVASARGRPPGTPSAGASNETSTTAPSSGWSGLSLQLGLARPASAPSPTLRSWHRSTRPRPSSAPHWPGCARSVTGSSRAARRGRPRAALEALTEEAPVEIEIGALPGTPRRVRRGGRLLRRLRSAQTQPEHPGQARGASRGRPARRRGRSRHRRQRDRRARGSRRRGRRDARGRTRGRRASEHPRGDPVRVVIADDEVLLREGSSGCCSRPASRSSARSAPRTSCCRKVELARPDVAIVDIRMPPTHTDEGIVAAQEIRRSHPEVGVLVLSHHLESRYAMRLIEEHPGGAGYLLKQRVSNLGVLTDALRRLRDGECVVDPTIVARLVQRARPARQLAELTEREREVLALMAEGRSNKAICARLFLSPKTVEAHVKHIFMKLDIDESADDHRRVLFKIKTP